MKTTAIIPCHNESKHILPVLDGVMRRVDEAIVVDNLSTDGTGELVRKYSRGNDAIRLLSCNTKGMGAALRTGIDAARDADVLVTLDGDGQHDPSDILPLVYTVLRWGADMAVGVRSDNHNQPKYRKLGNAVIAKAACIGSGLNLADAQCGLRAFNQKVAGIPTTELGFGCITEMLIKARKAGLTIVPVPVTCIYHEDFRDNSTINPVKHGVSVLARTVRWRVWEYLNV